jgi:hypothetical protein
MLHWEACGIGHGWGCRPSDRFEGKFADRLQVPRKQCALTAQK